MKLKKLLNLMERGTSVSICHSVSKRKIWQGNVEEVPNNLLSNYITLIVPTNFKLHIEVHESDTFDEVE